MKWTGIALVAVPAFACSSASELETIQGQLADIQLQVLQLQKNTASKQELADLGAMLAERSAAVQTVEAAIEAELGRLASEIEKLGSKLDDADFRLAQLSQQIAATNQELQAFRTAAETRRPPPPPPPVADVTDPQTLYDTAYADFQRGNYDLAILGFRQYLDSVDGTDLADNATYWIGECYYRQRKYQKAAAQFDEVITRFRQSDRIPSALLKKGYAYLELGQRAQGVLQLQHVVREYPGSDEAQLARQRLAEVGIDEAG